MRVPRVFIDQKVVSGESIFLSTDKVHHILHILHVLRLHDGDQIKLFNNSGFEFTATIIEAKNEFQTKISDCNQIGIIKKYLNKYFFKTKIEISGLKKHSIGYDRETPTKLIMLCVSLVCLGAS